MEKEIILIPRIELKWSDWIFWNNLKIDARYGRGIIVPNGKSGVYQVKCSDSKVLLTIGRASDLRMRIKQGLVKGKSAHSAGNKIRRYEDTSKIVVRWATTDRPAATEEELHKRFLNKFGKFPKYVEHT